MPNQDNTNDNDDYEDESFPMSTIQNNVDEVERAKSGLEFAIFHNIEERLKSGGFSDAVWGMMENTYTRDGVEVYEDSILDELEEIYLDNIHQAGFQALWKDGKWAHKPE